MPSQGCKGERDSRDRQRQGKQAKRRARNGRQTAVVQEQELVLLRVYRQEWNQTLKSFLEMVNIGSRLFADATVYCLCNNSFHSKTGRNRRGLKSGARERGGGGEPPQHLLPAPSSPPLPPPPVCVWIP